MVSDPTAELESWLSTQGSSLAEIRERFGVAEQARGVSYEKLRGVDRWGSGAHPGLYFFFRDGALVMLFVAMDQRSQPLDSAVLMSRLGGPGELRRSRAGKPNVQHVYAEQGVAFSERGGDVDFVEIFPPTTLARYEADIYAPPPKFIR